MADAMEGLRFRLRVEKEEHAHTTKMLQCTNGVVAKLEDEIEDLKRQLREAGGPGSDARQKQDEVIRMLADACRAAHARLAELDGLLHREVKAAKNELRDALEIAEAYLGKK